MKNNNLSLPGRLLKRLLDSGANLDYLWVFLLGSWPILYARLIGAHADQNGFAGYYSKFNWYSFAVTLPLTLWLFRWAMSKVAPVQAVEPGDDPDTLPPVVQLVDTPQGRDATYESLRRTMLAGGNLVFVLVLVTLFHVADMWEVFTVYLSGSAEGVTERDWSIMFAATAEIQRWENLLLVISAYALQFMLLVILFLFAVLIARHNWFFQGRIYQRRRVPDEDGHRYITIDLDDIDMCFGFKRANRAFNVQVQFLAVSGLGLLLSRYANLYRAGESRDALLLPDFGQIAIVCGWFAGLIIVTLPMWVKILPLFGRSSRSLVDYLKEFLPDARWPYGDSPTPQIIETLAARFSANAFWPTGNNQAKFLFLLSFVAMCLLLCPDPGIVSAALPLPDALAAPGWARLTGMVIYVAAAALLTGLLLLLFRLALIWVDPRLVKSPAEPAMTVRELNESLGVETGKAAHHLFISYRRQDSAAYAGRLKQTLEERFYTDNIFFDLEGIAAGSDFVDVIEEKIAASDVMLVVIGPQWLSAADDEGRPRLGSPDDYVTVEIATALQRKLDVIPVLVGGADFPKAEQLPDSIAGFARRNAAEITDSRWKSDVQRIVDAILAMVPGKGPQSLS